MTTAPSGQRSCYATVPARATLCYKSREVGYSVKVKRCDFVGFFTG